MMECMKLSEWARKNGVSRQSATRWFHAAALPVPARQLATGTILVDEAKSAAPGVAIYARVSSGDQRADLDRQVARLSGPPRKSLRVFGSAVWSGVGPGGDVAEIETADAVEGCFGGAGGGPVGQDRVLVAVPAGEVGGEAPLLGRSEVTQPAQGQIVVGGGAGDVGEVTPVADGQAVELRPPVLAVLVESAPECPSCRLGYGHRRRW